MVQTPLLSWYNCSMIGELDRLHGLKPEAVTLFRRVQGHCVDETSYTLAEGEQGSAKILVERNLCFYSLDRDHLTPYRHREPLPRADAERADGNTESRADASDNDTG